MTATDIPFLALTAGDLMAPGLKVLPAHITVRDAAKELARLGVHGAPVIDAAGRFLGTFSVSDVTRWVARQNGGHTGPGPCGMCTDWQMIDVAGLPAAPVAAYVTPDPVTVRAETPLPAVARVMLDRTAHRAVVVDADGFPVGVVSVTDVLRAVARAGGAD